MYAYFIFRTYKIVPPKGLTYKVDFLQDSERKSEPLAPEFASYHGMLKHGNSSRGHQYTYHTVEQTVGGHSSPFPF